MQLREVSPFLLTIIQKKKPKQIIQNVGACKNSPVRCRNKNSRGTLLSTPSSFVVFLYCSRVSIHLLSTQIRLAGRCLLRKQYCSINLRVVMFIIPCRSRSSLVVSARTRRLVSNLKNGFSFKLLARNNVTSLSSHWEEDYFGT